MPGEGAARFGAWRLERTGPIARVNSGLGSVTGGQWSRARRGMTFAAPCRCGAGTSYDAQLTLGDEISRAGPQCAARRNNQPRSYLAPTRRRGSRTPLHLLRTRPTGVALGWQQDGQRRLEPTRLGELEVPLATGESRDHTRRPEIPRGCFSSQGRRFRALHGPSLRYRSVAVITAFPPSSDVARSVPGDDESGIAANLADLSIGAPEIHVGEVAMSASTAPPQGVRSRTPSGHRAT